MEEGFTEQVVDFLWDKLDQQTDARLLEIAAECASFTEGSCDWVAYRLKDLVAEMAESLLRLRRNRGVPRT